MKKEVSVLAGVIGMLMCTGCASIVSHSSWPVTIKSIPPGANVIVKNSKGEEIHKGPTPTTVALKSRGGYFKSTHYQFIFEKEGCMQGNMNVSGKFNGWYVGNLVFGGVIGFLIVDPLTGAMWRMPETMTCNLGPAPNAPVKTGSLPSQTPFAGADRAPAGDAVAHFEKPKGREDAVPLPSPAGAQ